MNLKFWKKKQDDDMFIDHELKQPIQGVDKQYGAPQPMEHPLPPEHGRDFTVKEMPRPMQGPAPGGHSNDELILAKLDAIKAIIDNLSRRLERIEQIALEEERKGY